MKDRNRSRSRSRLQSPWIRLGFSRYALIKCALFRIRNEPLFRVSFARQRVFEVMTECGGADAMIDMKQKFCDRCPHQRDCFSVQAAWDSADEFGAVMESQRVAEARRRARDRKSASGEV